jgi:hypothetical protein
MKVWQHIYGMKAHDFLFDFIQKNYFTSKTTIQNMSWGLLLHWQATYVGQQHMIKLLACYVHRTSMKGSEAANGVIAGQGFQIY